MISQISIDRDLIQESILSYLEKSFKSVAAQHTLCKILDLAKTDTPVVLIGEMGSGKKRMGQIIHENSSRSHYPMCSFYCLDLTKQEYEEAFREHIYFSDDHFALKYNVIEKASRGVLYMDQFSELSNELMLKVVASFKKGSEQLFRYSQDAEPRLILSVNTKSYQKLQQTETWEQVLEILHPQSITVPALRERPEDIPLLINSFIESIRNSSERFGKLSISEAAIDACLLYNWPGNIIQLNNAILQGAILSDGETIEIHHLPFSINWDLQDDLRN